MNELTLFQSLESFFSSNIPRLVLPPSVTGDEQVMSRRQSISANSPVAMSGVTILVNCHYIALTRRSIFNRLIQNVVFHRDT